MSKEYVIWGIPPGDADERVLVARPQGHPITSRVTAESYARACRDRFGATGVRIQVLDMSGDAGDVSQMFAKSVRV